MEETLFENPMMIFDQSIQYVKKIVLLDSKIVLDIL
jgi:hypothetical protein